MNKIVVLLLFFAIGGFFIFSFQSRKNNTSSPTASQKSTSNLTNQTDIAQITIIAQGLDTPWSIVFLPDNSILVTERPGRVRRINENGILEPNPVATLSKVLEIGEGGLLGITIHPDFATNHFVYLYYTYSSNGNNTRNRVVRMTYENNALKNEQIIVDAIPGAANHNGGRIKFGPDKYLYITTGDAQEPSQAQDTKSLAGKILRVTDKGKPAPGNPFNTPIYSYGHRNPQGIAWDNTNQLWSTEHGRSGLQSGLDELNLIENGKNYGWPTIQGDETRNGMVTPQVNSGSDTWAPGGLTFLEDSLYFVGLRGETLYKVFLSDMKLTEHFKGEFGRIRDIIVGPDNMLYITTSNQDSRGSPQEGDDKIIRINPKKL